MGLLPPGHSSVSANYSIDGAAPQTMSLEPLSGTNSPVGNTTFFTSPNLPFANHTLDIAVTESGLSRNYSIDYLEIVIPSTLSSTEGSASNSKRDSRLNVGAIVGAVIGSLILILGLALLYWLWGRRFFRRTSSQDPETVQSDEKDPKGRGESRLLNTSPMCP